jgi:streptogramin lyase
MGPLVVPQAQSLVGPQQPQAAAAAAWSAPEAVAERARSRTAYHDESTQQVVQTLAATIPTLVSKPEGPLPVLPAGQSVSGFANSNAADVDLPDGQHGLIESTIPIATESSSGHWRAVDLSLENADGAYEPINPFIPIRLPKTLAAGAQLPSIGVSLTPVDEHGNALGGSKGQPDGASVLFANTETDSDTVLKPSPLGFDANTILRSPESPQQFYYKVGLPGGAHLVVPDSTGPHAVRVVKEGATLATIPYPRAHDTAGAAVPVTMTVNGNTLVLTVAHRSGSYDYPIDVDPEFEVTWINIYPGMWEFHEFSGYTYGKSSTTLWMAHKGSFAKTDTAAWSEHSQGYTKLYYFYVKDYLYPTERTGKGEEERAPGWLSAWIELFNESGEENQTALNDPYVTEASVCKNKTTCAPEESTNGNYARIELSTTEAGTHEFEGDFTSVSAALAEEKGKHSTVSIKTSPQKLDETENIFDPSSPKRWLGPHNGAFEFQAKDGGLGVETTHVEYKPAGGSFEDYGGKAYFETSNCAGGVECFETENETYTYNNLLKAGKHLPEGDGTLRVNASSAIPYSSSDEYNEGETPIKVDATPPHNITIKGLTWNGEKNEYEIRENATTVTVEASDGEGTTPSSGVASIGLEVDGHEIAPTKAGSCPEGPCTATAEWALNGSELGVGQHELEVVATDGAGNIATSSAPLAVYAASPVAVGPGSVNPESGDFAMSANDVNLSGGLSALTAVRHYDSRNVTEGEEGVLGPEWTLSLNSVESLTVLPDNSVMVDSSAGLLHFSVKSGGGFESPEGDANLTLEYKAEYEGPKPAYLLLDSKQDATTVFRLPSGALHWMASVSSGPIATETTTDEYTTIEVSPGKSVIEPTLELAPHPAATCVREKLEKGCRGLEFVYDEGETTAKGESRSEWGSYKHRLKEIIAVVYNPATSKMVKSAIAAYEYDKQGRLRAEWNPQIKPALKTTYGYDPENHVTAMTPPGQESWAFTYGTIPNDPSTGRLLKVTRAPASNPLWNGISNEGYTEQPKISGLVNDTPSVGKKLTVSRGGWDNEPFMFGYDWQLCNAGGEECKPIPGATNTSYVPTISDYGHRLIATVTATNGGGSAVASTLLTNPVELSTWYTLPAGSDPLGITRTEYWKSNIDELTWVTEPGTSQIAKITSSGEITQYKLPANSDPQGISPMWSNASNGELVWFAESGTSKLGKLTPEGALSEYSVPAGSEPIDVTWAEHESAFFTERGTNKIGEISAEGKITEYAIPAEYPGKPERIVNDSVGHLWFTHIGNGISSSIMEMSTTTGAILKNYPVAGEPKDLVAEGETENMQEVFAVDADGSAPKFTHIDRYTGEVNQYAMPAGTGEPRGISEPTEGRMYYTATGSGGKAVLGRATASGVMTNETLPAEDGELRYIVQKEFDDSAPTYFTSYTANKVGEVPPPPKEEEQSPEPGTTIEYGVTVYGADELPELNDGGKWGQTDLPVEGMAIFPPSQPRGWPAISYRGATTYYTDSEARTVNVVNPSGGVSTTEYSNKDQVVRTLSSANRAKAMEESNTIEAAEHLDTKSAYNTEGELTDVWGPLHTVKLANGKTKADEEVQARNHVHYSYDEHAPTGGEPYELVTKTTDGAETLSKEEFDKRTTVTAYGGQNNLGWKLRRPTSVTVDPEGLDLTTTTKYEESTGSKESTGNIIETQSPAASGKDVGVPPAFGLQFGSAGTGNGQFSHPMGTAVDSSEDVWVTDYNNNRVEKFSSTGTWLATYGKLGTSEKEVQFNGPVGIAINKINNVYVGDQNNNRIVEFNSAGGLVKVFGKAGEGAGQFKEPAGIAVDASANVWVADKANNRIQEFNEKGEFEAALGWGVSNGEAAFQICTTTCRAGTSGTGAGQFSGPSYISVSGGDIFVSNNNNGNVEEFSESTRKYVATISGPGSGKGQLTHPGGTSEDSSGDIYVTDTGNNRVQEFNISTGKAIKEFGVKGSGPGQFDEPTAITLLASGKMYIADAANNRIQQWVPTVAGNAGGHDSQAFYYSAKEEAGIATCEKHPEWVGLPCETKPAEQPGTTGPQLPVTVTTYNMWNQAEKVTETFGSTTRTKTTTYEEGGRPTQTEDTSSADTAMPKLKATYSTTTGLVEEESSTLGSTTHKILTTYNTLGAVATYTDSAGNTAHYSYYPQGSVKEVTDGSEEGKAKQAYTYSEASGLEESVTDSGAGTFGATYDVEGRLSSEKYPNGMTAYYTYNPVGTPTKLEYKKTTDCTEEHEKCVWFKDALVPSIHGEPLQQTSTLAEAPTYTYNTAGLLTSIQEIPAAGGCKSRLYSYDEEGNRATETQREPAAEGKCATEGGSTEWHTYDTGNHLTDTGIAYDAFGNATTLPAGDGGGTELTASYYVDSQLAKQTQSGETNEYELDPAGRTRQIVSVGTKAGTVTNHFDNGGEDPAWTSTTIEGKEVWTRDIAGIEGALAAIQTSGHPAELQLHDLEGNTVAIAALSETETKLLKTYPSTEFGVPTSKEQPPKYAWLGADGVKSELTSGAVVQDGVTYVPQTGRTLQTEPVEIPVPANAYRTYTDAGGSFIIESDANAGALRTAQYEATIHAEEQAATPPGAVPGPSGEGGDGCNGPECLGLHVLKPITLESIGCSFHEHMGLERAQQILLKGEISCQFDAQKIEFTLCLALYGKLHPPQEYATTECLEENGHPYVTRRNEPGAVAGSFFACTGEESYGAYMWAKVYQYSGLMGFGAPVEGHTVQGYAHDVCVSALPTLPN